MIFVVTFIGYEDDDFPVEVVGAYSSKEGAERAIRTGLDGRGYHYPEGFIRHHYDITEVELDGELLQA